MMYPFMTLDDQTEIVHSEMLENGKVKVYIEKPDAKDCFHQATCYLPTYEWQDIYGFSDEDIKKYDELLKQEAKILLKNGSYFLGIYAIFANENIPYNFA